MGKLILLNSNNECKSVSDKKPIDYSNTKAILIPLEGLETHIVLKPHEYLNFTSAVVRYSIQIVSINSTDDLYNDIDQLDEVTIKTDSLVKFYSLINSLDRVDFTNSFVSEYDIYRDVDGSYIYIDHLSVTLYKGNDVIYSSDYKAEKVLYGFLGTHHDLRRSIKDIYNIYKKNNKDYLIIKNNQWKFSSKIEDDSLVGIRLLETDSIYIMPSNLAYTLNRIISVEHQWRIYIMCSDRCDMSIVDTINESVHNNTLTDEQADYIFDDCSIDIFWEGDATIGVCQDKSHKNIPTKLFCDNINQINQNCLDDVVEFFSYISSSIYSNSFVYSSIYTDYEGRGYADILDRIEILYRTDRGIDSTIVKYINKNENISLSEILRLIMERS
jgi:hypothetical protein